MHGDLRHQGKTFESELNIVESDPFTRLNARLSVEKDNLTIEFYADNITNDTHYDYIYRLPNPSFVPLVSFSYQGLGVGLPSKREVGLRTSFSV